MLNGRGEATMGARSDFEQATRLATDMVTIGGLSEVVGPKSLSVRAAPFSEDTLRKVDLEVDRLLRSALEVARSALSKNRPLYEAVAKALVERETLDGETFRHLVEGHQVQPVVLRF
mmetsp:Transcript_103136/g.290144  ORF Transcript_103136/g.290144 Transcript_103136/m.290144 type:complete len:117 (+) Transcript_103136:2-352(+)